MKLEDLKIGKSYTSKSGWNGTLVGFDAKGDPILTPDERTRDIAFLEEDGNYTHTMSHFLMRYTEDAER